MEFMNTLIFNVLMALFVALAGIIARQLLPYLREKKEEAIEKIRQTRWAWCADIINAVVRAIEQTVSEEIHGEEKKAEAVRLIEVIFYQAGLHMTEAQIDALIEAAVNEMNSNNITVEPAIEIEPENPKPYDDGEEETFDEPDDKPVEEVTS